MKNTRDAWIMNINEIDPPNILDTLNGDRDEVLLPVRSLFISIPSEAHVKLTKETVSHVFNLESSNRKYQGIKHKIAKGYHLLDFEEIRSTMCGFFERKGAHVTEGYIISSREHLPIFKTFFEGLTREEVIQRLQESLLNIVQVKDNNHGKGWKLIGLSEDEISITTIAEKESLNILTFFPTSNKIKPNHDKTIIDRSNSRVRFYLNPCYRSSPWGLSTAADLFNYFNKDNIQVDMQYIYLDRSTMEINMFKERLRHPPIQDMLRTILPAPVVDIIRRDVIRQDGTIRSVSVLSSWEYFTISLETIEMIFFDGNQRFPTFLHPFYILDKLKEGIANLIHVLLTLYEETNEEDWEEEPYLNEQNDSWYEKNFSIFPNKPNEKQLQITSKFAEYRLTEDLCKVSSVELPAPMSLAPLSDRNVLAFPFFLPVPYLLPQEVNSAPPTITHMWLYANGSCYMDSWSFIIYFNPITGEITDFGVR